VQTAGFFFSKKDVIAFALVLPHCSAERMMVCRFSCACWIESFRLHAAVEGVTWGHHLTPLANDY
jgi:hypothetical protein